MDNKEMITKSEQKPVAKKQPLVVTPAVDIFENDNEILLHAEMPGVKKENVTINIDNGKLFLSGLRILETTGASRWNEFGDVEYSRTFSVPQTIDIAKVSGQLQDGVLELHLPKSEAAKPKQIKITSS